MESPRSKKVDKRRILFVGGLPASMPKEAILSYFGKIGEVLNVKIMKDKKTKLPKGYAFVTMVNHKLLPKIVLDTHIIDGRTVDCQIASKKGEKQAWKEEQKKRRVFVTGLSPDISSEELLDCLRQFGGIRSGYVIHDYYTKISKRYGYVEFEDQTAANKALKSEVKINGAKIMCMPYLCKHEPKKPKEKAKMLELQPARFQKEDAEDYIRVESEGESHSSEEDDSENNDSKSHLSVPYLTNQPHAFLSPQPRRKSDKRPSTEHLTLSKFLLQSTSNYRFNIQAAPELVPDQVTERLTHFDRSMNDHVFRRHSATVGPGATISAGLLLQNCHDSKLAQRRSLF